MKLIAEHDSYVGLFIGNPKIAEYTSHIINKEHSSIISEILEITESIGHLNFTVIDEREDRISIKVLTIDTNKGTFYIPRRGWNERTLEALSIDALETIIREKYGFRKDGFD
tara:strand:+ start:188 stop:523 length:336 start_codon:yes stop_codon:yes gene_type:complete